MTDTLQEAKDMLSENWRKKGAICPCCGRFVKLYDMKIPGVAVADLIRLYRLSKGQPGHYEHVSAFSNITSRSFPKLVYWGLCQSMPNDDPKKRTSGMWAITKDGIEFVEGRLAIPERSFYFNKKGRGLHGDLVGVKAALTNKFDYEELMSKV